MNSKRRITAKPVVIEEPQISTPSNRSGTFNANTGASLLAKAQAQQQSVKRLYNAKSRQATSNASRSSYGSSNVSGQYQRDHSAHTSSTTFNTSSNMGTNGYQSTTGNSQTAAQAKVHSTKAPGITFSNA